jgi:ABC-type uncharacterized transport system auxiliary subunit
MSRDGLRLACLTLACVGLGACLSFGPGEAAQIVYYQVTADPGPWSGGELPLTISLKPFTASEALEPEGIRYRTSEVEGGYWTDDRWAEQVPDMVAAILDRQLSLAGIFRRVNLMESAGFADLLLGGQVHRFEEEDRGPDWFAVVELTLEVSRSEDGEVVYHERFFEEERCEGRSVREVVRAMNRAMTRVVERFRDGIFRSLRGEV